MHGPGPFPPARGAPNGDTAAKGPETMAHWDDGYVSDVTYTSGYHNETPPVWLATAAALSGFTAPDLTQPFRYADLGCGNGVTALVVAATMPHAEVWACDFNPAHVENGRDIARRAGLTNIRFEEASFEDLTRLPADALPMFDYVVAHGILSWISRENRRHLLTVIGQRLAPGGIVYMSYNVGTGWTGMRPVRTLMRLLTAASPERTDLAAAGAFETLDKMKDSGAAMFHAHPALNARLALFRDNDHRYVAHELLNRDWHPVMFQTVAPAMAAIKCGHIGNASLQDNLENLTIPVQMREMFTRVRDPRLRETIRDIAGAIGFRRDLYQRGPRRMNPAGHERQVNAITLISTFRPIPETITAATSLGQLEIKEPRYRALLDLLSKHPLTIGEIRALEIFSGHDDPELFQTLVLLLAGGFVAPLLPGTPTSAARAATARLNRVHAELFELGHDLPLVAYPALGAAWNTNPLEIMALDALLSGHAAEEQSLTETVMARMRRSGRTLNQNGQPVTDPAALRGNVTNAIQEMLRERLPMMRRLGALSPAAASVGTEGARTGGDEAAR